MNKYAHTDKNLDTPIAVELIIEICQGHQHIQRKVIKDTVFQIHIRKADFPEKLTLIR